MAESGSVAWMFERRGYLTLDIDQGSEDEIMEIALEAGATDIEGDGTIWEVYTKPEELYKVKGGIEAKGKKCSSAEIYYEATTTIKPTPEQAKSAVNLIEALEDLDDTQNVHSNLDMDEELMAALG
jgi:transcriptional/translational regulatory protein YebC/TACO1